MKFTNYIIIFLLLILFILIISAIKEGMNKEPMMVYSLNVGDTMDGINKHLYSPNNKYRLIFDNGLKIQEIVFKKQIPQVNTGITESGFLEKHLLGNDKRIINRTAKSLTFDGNGLTLYDKTLNEENKDDDDDPVIQVESKRRPIKNTRARFNFDGYKLLLTNEGHLVARKSGNDYVIVSNKINNLKNP